MGRFIGGRSIIALEIEKSTNILGENGSRTDDLGGFVIESIKIIIFKQCVGENCFLYSQLNVIEIFMMQIAFFFPNFK